MLTILRYMIIGLKSGFLFHPKERKEEIATMETINNGKSIFEARLDVDISWQCLEYYAGLAGSMAGKSFYDQMTRRQKNRVGIKADLRLKSWVHHSTWMTLGVCLSLFI